MASSGGAAGRVGAAAGDESHGYNRAVSRYYGPTEADALVPELTQLLTRLRDQRTELVSIRDAVRAREGRLLDDPDPGSPGDSGDPGDPAAALPTPDGDDPELRRLTLRMRGIVDQMQADVAWLDERGIVLRDIAMGLLDFPALAAGRPVWLCWCLGEDRVGFWHPQDEGYAGRRPLVELPDGAARA